MYGGMLDFLQKNEDRFRDWDLMRLKGLSLDAAATCRMRCAARCCDRYAAPYSG